MNKTLMNNTCGIFGIFLFLFFGTCFNGLNAQQINPDALRAHTGFLAHDLLEGRGTASRGESLAALYIASQFREYGLKPISGQSSDFTIPIPLATYRFDESKTFMRIQSSEDERILSPPDFYHPGGASSSFKDFSGDLIWTGSVSNTLTALDSYSENLNGKVVVMAPPVDGLGEVRSELYRRGAEGAIEVIPTDFYDRLRVVRGPIRYSLPPEIRDPINQSRLPRIAIGPKGLEPLEIEGLISSDSTHPGIRELNSRVEVQFFYSSKKTNARNVAALLSGSDPELSDNIVVYMAHYDHVGFGEPAGQDSIWNGFVDNASGTAMVMDIARVLSSDPPPYSVLFLLTSAEEQGLLGANWFVHSPPVMKDRIMAAINLDGGAPPADIDQWNLAASPNSGLTGFLNDSINREGLNINVRPINSHSDHWPFHQANIPAYFLFPGSQAVSGVAHTPGDEWRADFPFEGLVEYAEMTLKLGEIIGRHFEEN